MSPCSISIVARSFVPVVEGLVPGWYCSCCSSGMSSKSLGRIFVPLVRIQNRAMIMARKLRRAKYIPSRLPALVEDRTSGTGC